ncbi:MAG: hypothetical protein CMJ49_02655 [Planctomycetaceae bacterium]|nr:hypothetical protein [Planctomycetaceae bacterium]
MIKNIQHTVIDLDKTRYAGHPRQGGIFDFGNGELAVLYNRAPCAYKQWPDVRHDVGGYHQRSQVILARTYDGGATWDRANDVVVFDRTTPDDAQLQYLEQTKRDPQTPRDTIDLNSPDTAIHFGFTWISDCDPPRLVGFALRSADRGHTWESVPTLLNPRTDSASAHYGIPLIAMPDGTHLGAMSHSAGNMYPPLDGTPTDTTEYPHHIALYGTDDHGLTWEPLSMICHDPTGLGFPAYAALLLLPSGRLQCYTLNIGGQRDTIQVCHSDDGGYSWSDTRPIVGWGRSPWVNVPQQHRMSGRKAFGKFLRSPWPLRLADGRIVVIFGRRKPPYGIGLIVSENDGDTWSDQQIIRADSAGPDLGYNVAVETAPGTIFTAYYYTDDDGNGFGGTRYIAGSHIEI